METKILDETETVLSRDQTFIPASFRCAGVSGHFHSLL